MRTIKFRGIDTMTNRMVYGDLAQQKLADGNITTAIVQTYATYDVIPETVGQFTGMYDKNGKEIYEGDIVLIESVVFDDENAVVEWEELHSRYIFKIVNDDGYLLYLDCGDEITVIGNIYDNPEMLKGGEE